MQDNQVVAVSQRGDVVENYPVITFKSTGVQPTREDRYRLTGDLADAIITVLADQA